MDGGGFFGSLPGTVPGFGLQRLSPFEMGPLGPKFKRPEFLGDLQRAIEAGVEPPEAVRPPAGTPFGGYRVGSPDWATHFPEAAKTYQPPRAIAASAEPTGGPGREPPHIRYDTGEGWRTWTPGQAPSRGGFVTSDIESLPWNQRPHSWRKGAMEELAYNQARLAPMMPFLQLRAKSALESDVERGRQERYQTQAAALRSSAQQHIAEALAVPGIPEEEKKRRVMDIESGLEAALQDLRESTRLSERLTR